MSSKRSHTKSRLGCKQCKSRHIKCDQVPPCCGNCTRKGMECEFQETNPALDNIRILTPTTFPQQRPENPSSSIAAETPGSPVSSPSFSLDDLSLFRHFILYTSHTMDPLHNEHYLHIWQHEVPRLAQGHLFLLHAVLGFAAAHQASYGGDAHTRFLLLARRHYGKALASFRESVSELSAERAEALLCFSIVIAFLSFRLEAEKRTEAQDPIGEFLSLLRIFHNSIGVLLEFSEHLRSSVVGGLLHHTQNQCQHAVAPDVELSLNRLEMLVFNHYNSDPADKVTIDQAIVKLRYFYTRVSPRPETWAYLMSWPIQVGVDIASLLEQRDPVALCILAHWCVPVYHAPNKWYFGDWARRLMVAIAQELHGSEWFDGISWPLNEMVGEGYLC